MELLEQLAKSGAWVDFTQGLDIRLTTPDNISLLNKVKCKMLHFAWDNPREDLSGCFKRFMEMSWVKAKQRLSVYVLTNYNSTLEEDLCHRANVLFFCIANCTMALVHKRLWLRLRLANRRCSLYIELKH